MGSASVAVDLTAFHHRFFFAGYEDPTSGTSDAKLDFVSLEGPPLPPLPPLRLVSHSPESGEATVAWPSAEGETYTLQSTADLAAWEVVDGSDFNPFAGDGSEIEFTDTPGTARRFYRLIRP